MHKGLGSILSTKISKQMKELVELYRAFITFQLKVVGEDVCLYDTGMYSYACVYMCVYIHQSLTEEMNH